MAKGKKVGSLPILNDKSPRTVKGGAASTLGEARPNGRSCGAPGDPLKMSTNKGSY